MEYIWPRKKSRRQQTSEKAKQLAGQLLPLFNELGEQAESTICQLVDQNLDKLGQLADPNKQKACLQETFAMIQSIAQGQTGLGQYTKLAKMINRSAQQAPTLRIMLIGGTQVGKSETIRKAFKLDIKIANGTKSDTNQLIEYQVKHNDLNLILVDSPGFFDSRGQTIMQENYTKIIDYLDDHEVDLILWFAKLSDTANATHQMILSKLTEGFGSKFWKNTLIVLTHANDNPDAHYVQKLSRFLTQLKSTNDLSHLSELEQHFYATERAKYLRLGEYQYILTEAWQEFAVDRQAMWRETFQQYAKKKQVETVLIENAVYLLSEKNELGDYLLRDGQPMYETFYRQLFKITKAETRLNVLLSLADEEEDVFYETQEMDSDDHNLYSIEEENKEAEVETRQPSQPKPETRQPSQSQSSQPGTRQPSQSQPGQSQPSQPRPETRQPSQPETRQPSQPKPETRQPGQSQPSRPETSQRQPQPSQPGQPQQSQSIQPRSNQPRLNQPKPSIIEPNKPAANKSAITTANLPAIEAKRLPPLSNLDDRQLTETRHKITRAVEQTPHQHILAKVVTEAISLFDLLKSAMMSTIDWLKHLF